MFIKTEGFFFVDCFLRKLLGKMCMRELIIRRYHFTRMPRYGDASSFMNHTLLCVFLSMKATYVMIINFLCDFMYITVRTLTL